MFSGPDSEKASAALSRRCLQHLLREKAGVKKGDLANEIQQVLDSKQLPGYLAEDLDAIRNIGNFAAHPDKVNKYGHDCGGGAAGGGVAAQLVRRSF